MMESNSMFNKSCIGCFEDRREFLVMYVPAILLMIAVCLSLSYGHYENKVNYEIGDAQELYVITGDHKETTLQKPIKSKKLR